MVDQFEDDLRTMFAAAPPAADADDFALTVDRGLDRIRWVRLTVVSALGLLGGLIAWSAFGVSLNDLTNALSQVAAAAGGGALSGDQTSGWAAMVLLVALGVAVVRPLLSES